MSRTFHHGDRKIRVKGIRKSPPDLRRLARALIELVEAEAEAAAEAEELSRIKNGGSIGKTGKSVGEVDSSKGIKS
jgi:hypothetical protein